MGHMITPRSFSPRYFPAKMGIFLVAVLVIPLTMGKTRAFMRLSRVNTFPGMHS